MKIRMLLSLSLLVSAVSLPAAAQPPAQADAKAAAAMAAQMEAFQKLATPGEHHKRLDSLVGNWTYTIKMYGAPGAPPVESKGTMDASWILGGRYVESHYKGDFMGQTFEGRSTDGYDNFAQTYVSSWVDNFGTGIVSMAGSCDTPCKSITTTGEMPDPMSGKKAASKSVLTFLDANHFKLEGFMADGKGGMVPSMKVLATRK